MNMYRNLTALVDNLNPYWAYIRCNMHLLGPPRAWRVDKDQGILTIWPRLNFFVDDMVYLGKERNEFVGPVMSHGNKKENHWTEFYKDIDKCELSTDHFVTSDALGRSALALARSYSRA